MTQIYTRSGGETLLNMTAAGNQQYSVVAALPAGGFVAAWQMYGFEQPLRGQRFDSNGSKLGGEFTIAIPSGAIIDSASILGLASGGFVVAWGVFGDSTDPTNYNVKAQLFDPSGAKVGDELVLSAASANGQMMPNLSPVAGGGFVATWMDYVGDGISSCIKGQLFDAQGAKSGSEFVVNTTAAGQQLSPSASMLTGGFVVAWQDSVPDGTHNGVAIRAQRFDSAGTKVGDELLVSSPGGPQATPEVAGLAGGGFVVVWEHRSTNDVHGQLYDAAGAKVGGVFTVHSSTTGFQSQPAVTALPFGGFVVSWSDGPQNGDSSGNAIRAQIFEATGARSGDEFIVNIVTGQDQEESALAVLTSGDFVASWTSKATTGGDGSGYAIKAQIFTPGGDGFGTVDYSDDPGPVVVNRTADLFLSPAGHPYGTRSLGPGEALDGSGNYEMVSGIENFILSAGNDRLVGSEGANRVDAGGGNDNIQAAGGDDIVLGGTGDDRLSGNSGNDQLQGGDGDDILTGGPGADSLDGGAGTDTVDYSQDGAGGGIIVNLSGNSVSASVGLELAPGQARDSHGSVDTLAGVENFKTGSAADIVYGGAAANRIETGGGGDFLIGGAGADTLIGGSGDDQYFIYAADSAAFEDMIVELSGGGTDQIRTDLPSFSLAGHPEIENLLGLTNIAFTFTGNDRDNYLQGNAGADILEGGLGNDDLVGLGGIDTMRGGLGDDSYRVEEIGDVVEENEGEGTDVIWTTLATYSLLGTQVENLFALNNIAHNFRGSAAANVLASGDFNDVFLLQDGGEDAALGSGGNDVVYFGTALSAGDVADGGDGRDAIVLQGNVTAVLSETNLVDIESISIQSGANSFFGDTANNFYDYDVTTADGNVAAGVQLIVNAQSLRAGEDFTFDGSAESDGKFIVYGGHGVDNLTGGDGVDVFFFEGSRWGPNDKVDGGAGREEGAISAGDGLTHIGFAADALTNIESISVNNFFATDPSQRPSYELVLNNGNVAPGGTLIVNGSSIPLGQVVNIDGSSVHDGNLILLGGGGHDVVTGGDGADLIIGGGGADGLSGGAGADTFRYDAASDSTVGLPDTIGGFQTGIDRIDLSRIDANTTAAGDQAFSWIGANAFSGVAGQLKVMEDNGRQRIEGDTDGDGLADLVIVLQIGTAPLVQGDFLL